MRLYGTNYQLFTDYVCRNVGKSCKNIPFIFYVIVADSDTGQSTWYTKYNKESLPVDDSDSLGLGVNLTGDEKVDHWNRPRLLLGGKLYHLVGIVLIVSQDLLDVDNFWARVPSHSTSYQVPVLAFFHGDFLQGRKGRNRHRYRTAVLQIHLKLSTLRKW